MERTLLLNTTYEPLQVVSWRRAVKMLFQEKVELVEAYERKVRSVTLAVAVPSVIRLLHYVKVRPFHSQVRFNRPNLYGRDKYRCQYCGERLPAAELTYDHVIPVARGGRKSWENIVTCCVPCNRKKGDRTPEEVGFHLRKKPRAPIGFPAKVRLLVAQVQAPECWKSYIFWEDSGGARVRSKSRLGQLYP
ncbi:MAG: HNH endonuclease [Acidobacteriota bacterium]|nr:MAG: HNH endonuclease [Acidobacteriota bacterium]